MSLLRKLVAVAVAAVVMFTLSSCTDANTANRSNQLNASQKKFDARTPPNVSGDAEYSNYMRAQQDVYDDPSTIIWCTVFPDSPASPIFTVPIAGKLTSSSVSYYPGSSVDYDPNGNVLVENQSVDGLYHGTPPPYRYGFTPGGQYVDFSNLPVFCTTSLTEFQRQTLTVSNAPNSDAEKTQSQAEKALKGGNNAEAQKLIDQLATGGQK